MTPVTPRGSISIHISKVEIFSGRFDRLNDRVRISLAAELVEATGLSKCHKGIAMPHMYILECVDGTYYTGSTVDLRLRVWQHEDGIGAKYTSKRLPVMLVYCEEFSRVEDAFHREKQVQGWIHAKKRALIEANTRSLPELS